MEKSTKKKKLWLWIIIIVAIIAVVSIANGDKTTTTYQKNNKVEVTVVDFSAMTREDIKTWFDTNKINGKITEEYSSDVAKGSFVSQSVAANTVIHEGDKITVIYSLGKEPSAEQKNALRKAETYSKTMHMSKNGIYNQLTSAIEGFSKETAQYAIDNLDVDWKENALEKAKSYQTTMSMSKKAIYNQLTSTIEGFTKEEAQYAIDNLEE